VNLKRFVGFGSHRSDFGRVGVGVGLPVLGGLWLWSCGCGLMVGAIE
jgi:hypothetical protein